MRKQARGWSCQNQGCGLDFGAQRRDSCETSGLAGAGERGARRPCLNPPQRDPCDDQFVRSPQRRRKGGRVELAEGMLGFTEVTDQQEASDLEIARMGRVQAITVLLECHARRAK